MRDAWRNAEFLPQEWWRNVPPKCAEHSSSTCLKVFVSYAHSDVEAAVRIAACLTACGVDVWLDQREIAVGDSIPFRISQGLTESQYVVLLVSAKSTASRWVEREWLPTLLREVDSGQTALLPARLDDCTMPMIIADKMYADFRTSFFRGMSDLVNVVAAHIFERAGHRIAQDPHLHQRSWMRSVAAIVQDVERDESVELAFLLNVLAYSKIAELPDADADVPSPTCPAGLHGTWKSLQGWNAGDVLRLDAGHSCDYGEIAVGSFSGSLEDGVLQWVREVEQSLFLFRWHQEFGAGMGPTVVAGGFGVWRVDTTLNQLDGIWWYDTGRLGSHGYELPRQAFRWRLERTP